LKLDKDSLLLYAVTDRTWVGNGSLEEQVEAAIQGGVTFLQLREKELPYEAFMEHAMKIKEITDKTGIPYIINDSIEVALACGANGVHVGQSDLSAGEVRKRIGKGRILGVSVQTTEQAVLAEKEGADYLGVGAVFSTSTKLDAAAVSFESLKAICEAVSIPVVAIGGISRDNVLKLSGSGVNGIAVVSAIFAQKDIRAAAREMAALARRIVKA
jgi:thiamine-phosphate pyrophosphorylase